MTTSSSTRTLDNDSYAENPGQMQLADEKLEVLRPDLYGLAGLLSRLKTIAGRQPNHRLYIEEQLQFGASNPAVVVGLAPLRIAAYAYDLGGIAMLGFDDAVGKHFRLQRGTRLLSVNTYRNGSELDPDLTLEKGQYIQWTGFHPLIADFVAVDNAAMQQRKASIGETLWIATERLGTKHLNDRPRTYRDGRPVFAAYPANGG